MCTGFPLRSSCVVSSVSSCLLSFSSAVLFLHQQGAHSFLLAAGPQRSFKQWWPLTTNARHDPGLPPPFLLILKRLAAHPLCSHFLVHPFWRQSPNSLSCDRQVGPSLVSRGQWRRCKRLKWWDIIDLDWPVYAVWLSHRMVIWCSFVTTEFS